MTKLLYVAIVSAFVNNVVIGQMLGVNAAMRGSDRFSTALKLSFGVLVVTFVSSAVTWPIGTFLLDRFSLSYLQTILFLVVEAVLATLFTTLAAKRWPRQKESYLKLLPLILINSAVIGVLLTNVQVGYSFLRSMVNSVCGAIGFAVAVLILAGVRERIAYNDVPKPFEGMPILLVVCGLMAIAVYGFTGLL